VYRFEKQTTPNIDNCSLQTIRFKFLFWKDDNKKSTSKNYLFLYLDLGIYISRINTCLRSERKELRFHYFRILFVRVFFSVYPSLRHFSTRFSGIRLRFTPAVGYVFVIYSLRYTDRDFFLPRRGFSVFVRTSRPAFFRKTIASPRADV